MAAPDKLFELLSATHETWNEICAHVHPGGLTQAEDDAWNMEHEALWLRHRAACMRYQSEKQITDLLQMEVASVAH